MKTPKNIQILFVAGFGPIVRDQAKYREFYRDTLGLAFNEDSDGYMYADTLDGVKHFALWPLEQAAVSCFGTDRWPSHIPVPQGWVEFDVADIEAATAELKQQGFELLSAAKEEPWGQVVTRLLGPEGFLVGITHTPSLRQ